jgi:hypothetical protein
MIVEVKKPVTAAKIEKATLLVVQDRKQGFNAKKHAGKLKNVFGDAMEYQKKVRNEWN